MTCAIEAGSWRKHGRLIACALSAAFMLAGAAAATIERGSLMARLRAAKGPLFASPHFSLRLIDTYGGWFILPKALFSAKNLRPDMNLLMTVAVVGAGRYRRLVEAASVAFCFPWPCCSNPGAWGGREMRSRPFWTWPRPRPASSARATERSRKKRVDEVPVGAVVLVRPGERFRSMVSS